MKKFILTKETKEFKGIILHRIQAVKTFGGVLKGEKGGWIEKEENLSQFGNAWIDENAQVFGNARVCGNARVSGNAIVHGNARVSGNARVFGSAHVFGNARITKNAWVSDFAQVFGNVKITGNAWIKGNVIIDKFVLKNGVFFLMKSKREKIKEIKINKNFVILVSEGII